MLAASWGFSVLFSLSHARLLPCALHKLVPVGEFWGAKQGLERRRSGCEEGGGLPVTRTVLMQRTAWLTCEWPPRTEEETEAQTVMQLARFTQGGISHHKCPTSGSRRLPLHPFLPQRQEGKRERKVSGRFGLYSQKTYFIQWVLGKSGSFKHVTLRGQRPALGGSWPGRSRVARPTAPPRRSSPLSPGPVLRGPHRQLRDGHVSLLLPHNTRPGLGDRTAEPAHSLGLWPNHPGQGWESLVVGPGCCSRYHGVGS